MMKKWFKVILTAAFALTFCLSLFFAVNTTTAKADGESYTLAFETGTPSVDSMWAQGWWTGAESAAGLTGDGSIYTFDFATANNAIYTHSASGAALTVGKSYCISFEYKADSDAYFHVAQNSPWVWIQTDIHATTEWQTFEKAFTAGCETLIFQGTPYKVYLKNLKFTEVETKTVTAGATIGELPAVPAKEGYAGYWAVDGKEITAETAYNYGADKIAKPAYKENTFKITFENDLGDLSTSADGWWGTTPKIETDGAVMQRNGENANYYVGHNVYTNVTEGKKYRVHISVKCDNMFVNFAVNNPWYVFASSWICNSEFVKYTYDYTAAVTGKIDFIFQLNAADVSGAKYIVKDFYMTEIVENTIKKGETIGELPAVPEKTGYTGYWAIDGVKITAETVYDYEESKTAKLLYEANKYTLTLGETDKEITYGKAIGELPEVPAKKGHTGYWTVKGEKITAETVYYETENATAEVKYEANKYKLTLGETELEVTYGEEIGELPAIGTEARKGYEYAWFIDGNRLNDETVWEYTENKTATETETLIQYKIEFKIGDTIVKTVYYTVETEEIEEPAILPREGYTAKWEDYTLDGGDKVVNAVYTPIETPDDSSSADSGESGGETSGGETADSGNSGGTSSSGNGGDSCFAGINGLPMVALILGFEAVVFVIKRKKNA